MGVIQKRSGSFRALVRRRGFTFTATFDSSEEAQAFIDKTEKAILQGRAGEVETLNVVTVGDLLDRYAAWKAEKDRHKARTRANTIRKQEGKRELRADEVDLSSSKATLSHITSLRRLSICSMLVKDVRQSDIQRLISEMQTVLIRQAREDNKGNIIPEKRGYDAETIIRRVNLLSHAFNVARQLPSPIPIDHNPCRGVEKPSRPRGRTRRFQGDEETLVLKEALKKGFQVFAILVAAIATGARQGELLGLRWRDVNFETGEITIIDSKTGEPRSVPMSEDLRRVLEALHRRSDQIEPDDTLFQFTSRNAFKVMIGRLLRKHLGLRFHDLRHEAISTFFEATDFRDAEIMSISGHTTDKMLRRYNQQRKRLQSGRNQLPQRTALINNGEPNA